MALQNMMYFHLSRAYGNGNQTVRPAVFYTLQQLERKTKSASQSASDAETRPLGKPLRPDRPAAQRQAHTTRHLYQ